MPARLMNGKPNWSALPSLALGGMLAIACGISAETERTQPSVADGGTSASEAAANHAGRSSGSGGRTESAGAGGLVAEAGAGGSADLELRDPSVSYWKFGHVNDDDVAIGVDAEENVYIAGDARSPLEGMLTGTLDVYLRKYDASGNVLWTRQWGGPDLNFMQAMAVDASGNVYVARETFARSGNDYLEKYDTDGHLLWSQQSSLVVNSIAVSADNHLYVAALGDWSNGAGSPATVSNYDATGSLEWTRQFGTAAIASIGDMALDSVGNIYVVASDSQSSFIYELDAGQRGVWTDGLALLANQHALSLAVDSSQNLYIGGYVDGALSADGSAFVQKYAADRSISWTKQFGTAQNAAVLSIRLDARGNFYLAGHTEAHGIWPDGTAIDSAFTGFVRKYDPDGGEQWEKPCAGNYWCDVVSLAVARSGNVYGAAWLDEAPLVMKLAVH